VNRLLVLAFAISLSASVWTVEFVVAPSGNDANPGTLAQTFATLPRAQQAARKSATKEPVTIFLREGTYALAETMILTAEDSGTQAAPVSYQAYQKEVAIISGGVRLTDLKWVPYQNGIMQAKVPAGFTTDQLFVNGELQPMARYPNFDPNERHFNGFAADAFSPERAAKWSDPTGGFIHALHNAAWGGMHYTITGKSADNKITYEGGWQNNRPAGMHRDHRFVENIFEELDAPGEWFLNSKTHSLCYYPTAGLDLAKASFDAVRLKHIIECRGTEQAPVKFVSFKGLTFRHALRTFMENKEPLVRSDWTTYRGGAVVFAGTEDCAFENCFVDQVGGNAVFVNNYNRRLVVRGCHIAKAGGNGVAFVGDRDAARVPRDWKDNSQKFATLDRTPGPKTNNYPADCIVEECLIYQTGRVEKQTAPVQIELAQSITVRHCSLYDVPRAGINIGDGCWGGHVIEFCDIFDTIKETGDHGSFNSWGRDRFWGLNGLDLNKDETWEANKGIPMLDAVKTTILRNNRWRCDHGWDIDLDDGSSNYEIRNNLCLNGGLKNREGFNRVVENNIMINNGFHPHVWYKHSEDIVRRNIMCTDHYLPAGGMPSTPWGKEMDDNIVHFSGATGTQPAVKLAEQSKRDARSIITDVQFIDPEKGDFRVKDTSPALKLGFVNFPMDQFGVQKPELKAIARTPVIPTLGKTSVAERGGRNKKSKAGASSQARSVLQASARDIVGLGDRSAYGLPDESGVLFINVPAESAAAKAGIQKDDVIIGCNEQPVKTVGDWIALRDKAAGKKLALSIVRKQNPVAIEITDYVYTVTESQATPEFKLIPLVAPGDVVPVKALTSEPSTSNDPLATLLDGKLAKTYGPVFGNGTLDGQYKMDFGAAQNIAQVNSFTFVQGGTRGRQHFILFGSNAAAPGHKFDDASQFTPIIEVDTLVTTKENFVATSIRRSNGQPIGSFRWLVWAVVPISSNDENSTYQELQVIPAK